MENDEEIFFSIVIPVHNREHTLDRCIQSILNQTYTKFELILVDDHSTDGSVQLIEKYRKKDSRIVLVNQSPEKHGAQAARNSGIVVSKYDWIMFNDSDDTWENNKIEKQFELLKAYNFDKRLIQFCNCNTINVATNETRYWALPHVPQNKSYEFLLKQPSPIFISLVCSKELLIEINLLDENVPAYQEWDTSIRLAKVGYFVHAEEPLVNYFIGANDAISKSSERDFLGRCYIYNKFKDEIIRVHGKKKYMKMISDNLFHAANISMFDSLKSNNSIIKSYETNLIQYFGGDYKNQIIIFSRKIDKGTRYKSIIKKIITRPYKIPIWIFKRLKSLFVKEHDESYQDKIDRHIKNYKSTVFSN